MKIKRNKKSCKWFLCGLILVVVLTISYRVSKANYRISNSIELTTGKVVSSPYDFKLISMYIDGIEQDKDAIISDSGYAINEEQSYCYKDNKSNKDNNARLFTDSLGNHVFKGISKGSKCIIYFDKTKTMEELLNNYYTDKRVRENGTFNQIISGETTRTIFSAPDDDGTSYYFAGNPTDNWVLFGEYYWRVIRINGDGTIRMIYQGTAYDENDNRLEPQTTGEETQIGISAFNEKDDDNAYIGYMYGTPGSSTYEETHKNTNDSTIKIALDNWFNNSNLKQEQYFSKIDLNAGFCNDRQATSSETTINGAGGFGNVNTYYGARTRVYPANVNSNILPSFSCKNQNDLFTYRFANRGNGVLINPVGLITVDEATYAGGVITNNFPNNNYYLYTEEIYWTMSPIHMHLGSYSALAFISFDGSTDGNKSLKNNFGIRPVINLRSDVTFTGNGTQFNPFKVVS